MSCASTFGFVGERGSFGRYLRELPDPLVAWADVLLHGALKRNAIVSNWCFVICIWCFWIGAFTGAFSYFMTSWIMTHHISAHGFETQAATTKNSIRQTSEVWCRHLKSVWASHWLVPLRTFYRLFLSYGLFRFLVENCVFCIVGWDLLDLLLSSQPRPGSVCLSRFLHFAT